MAITSYAPVTTPIAPRFTFTGYLVPLGRVLFVLIFLFAVPNLFSQAGIGYAAHQGVPAASVLVPLSGVLALVGGGLRVCCGPERGSSERHLVSRAPS